MTSGQPGLRLPIDPERPTGWALLECLYCLVRDVAGLGSPGVRRLPAGAPWRVFLSHTSDLREHPPGRSFVDAAERAVIRAGHAVADMAYFAARDATSADHCAVTVARADVLVAIVGTRYGSPVPARPHLSYSELELEAAAAAGLPRLVFLIGEDSTHLPRPCQPAAHAARQRAFRGRLMASGLLVARIESPTGLELTLLHSLTELQIAAS